MDVRAEITRLRAEGLGTTDIARSLNTRGIPTPTGAGRWWHSTVHRTLHPDSWRDYQRRYRARNAQR